MYSTSSSCSVGVGRWPPAPTLRPGLKPEGRLWGQVGCGWNTVASVPGFSPAPASSLPDRLLAPPTAGGFATFSSCFPSLCEGKPAALLPVSLSQPCLPVPSVGLTRILPHLYLGSQKDVLNKVCAQAKGEGSRGRKGAEG